MLLLSLFIIFYLLIKIKQIYLTWPTEITYFFIFENVFTPHQYYFLHKKNILPRGVALGVHLVLSK
jgi:hypothetical protein